MLMELAAAVLDDESLGSQEDLTMLIIGSRVL
jgi:hypothetical protein